MDPKVRNRRKKASKRPVCKPAKSTIQSLACYAIFISFFPWSSFPVGQAMLTHPFPPFFLFLTRCGDYSPPSLSSFPFSLSFPVYYLSLGPFGDGIPPSLNPYSIFCRGDERLRPYLIWVWMHSYPSLPDTGIYWILILPPSFSFLPNLPLSGKLESKKVEARLR